MTVPTAYKVSGAARRAVFRATEARRRARYVLPRLQVTGRPTAAPTAWFLCPDWDKAAGGIRKQYRAVDVLNAAGLEAAIVHRKPGFACSWFEHSTRVVAAGEIQVAEGDVIAVPEIYGREIGTLPSGVRQVIFNQNAYVTLETLAADGAAAAAPYVDNPDLAAVTAVSEQNAELLSYAFPGAPIRRIHYGIDPAVHRPPAQAPGRRIAYMTRRRPDEARQVLALLERRGALAGWEVVAIEGKTEAEVAELLRSSQVFLCFSELEGFGLPPVEALACGALVVGYPGFGGREFFHEPFAVAVEDGDVAAYARAVEDLLGRIDNDPAGMRAAAAAGSRFVLDRYSTETERADLVDLFGPLLAR